MLIKEEDAKTKICHRTLAAVHSIVGAVAPQPRCCLGSVCMGWRWHMEDVHGDTGKPATLEEWRKAWGTAAQFEIRQEFRGRGFCGLAYGAH